MSRKQTAHEKQLACALEKLLRAYDALMPGIWYIAVPDYALINEAPLEAKKALWAFKNADRKEN